MDMFDVKPVEENTLKLDGIAVNLPINTEPVFKEKPKDIEKVKSFIVVFKNGDTKVLSKYDQLKKLDPKTLKEISTNNSKVVQAASASSLVELRKKYIQKELVMLASWLSGSVEERYKHLVSINFNRNDTNFEWLYINGLPLNNSYPKNFENIAIWLKNYPEVPPPGFYIPDDSPNKGAIQRKVEHLFDSNPYNGHFQMPKGLSWVCLHYTGWKWQFNYDNPEKGDNLYKYILQLHSHFCNNFAA